MSSMQRVDNYLIDYSGMLNTVPSSRINALMANDDDLVNVNFATQLGRVVNAGIDFESAMPAKAGGLIMRCSAANAEKVYDAVFGLSAPSRDMQPKAARMESIFDQMAFSDVRGLALGDFTHAAKGKVEVTSLAPSFRQAASQNNVVHPVFGAQPIEMRYAA